VGLGGRIPDPREGHGHPVREHWRVGGSAVGRTELLSADGSGAEGREGDAAVGAFQPPDEEEDMGEGFLGQLGEAQPPRGRPCCSQGPAARLRPAEGRAARLERWRRFPEGFWEEVLGAVVGVSPRGQAGTRAAGCSPPTQ